MSNRHAALLQAYVSLRLVQEDAGTMYRCLLGLRRALRWRIAQRGGLSSWTLNVAGVDILDCHHGVGQPWQTQRPPSLSLSLLSSCQPFLFLFVYFTPWIWAAAVFSVLILPFLSPLCLPFLSLSFSLCFPLCFCVSPRGARLCLRTSV